MVDYVFTRNQMSGIYPPEADGIGIPIFENQLFLFALAVLIAPTTILGSRWFFKKLFSTHVAVRVVALVLFAGLYVLALLISFSLTMSHVDRDHIEIGFSYAAMLVALSLFFIWDGVRAYRKISEKPAISTEAHLMESKDA
jgi:hypothetical protein